MAAAKSLGWNQEIISCLTQASGRAQPLEEVAGVLPPNSDRPEDHGLWEEDRTTELAQARGVLLLMGEGERGAA